MNANIPPAMEIEEITPDGTSIGDLLRASRNRRNEELSEVSEALRIRQVYLEAIENNKFEELPGAIYAIGFIRTYAEHLGLDGEEVVRRYKSETTSSENLQDLTFPSLVPEHGIPGGTIVRLGLVLAAIGYGGWYYVSTKNIFVTEQVPPVPEKLAAIVGEKPVATEPVKTAEEPTSAANASPVEKAEEKPVETPVEAAPNSSPESPTEKVKSEEVVKDAAQPVEKIAEKVPEKVPEKINEKTLAPEPVAEKKVEPTPVTAPEPKPAAETKPAAAPEVAALPESKPDPKPAPVATTGESRITLRAVTDSYIQVRDNEADQLLITRLLKKGDSYNVPNRSGLSLITGNAGALEILVDGTAVPSIGPVGAVRRNVVLEAEKLKDGSAVIE